MFRTDPRRRRKHGLRRLVLFLVAFVLTVLLLAHVDSNAAPRAVSTQAKFAGAFVNWGPIGREHTLLAWEKWLKQKPSSVLGVDFYAETTWEDYTRLSWVPSERTTWPLSSAAASLSRKQIAGALLAGSGCSCR